LIDRYLPPIQNALLGPVAKALAARRVSANSVTLLGFVVGLAAAVSIACEGYLTGLLLVLANRLFDGIDGVLARTQGPTDRGAFLDIAFDFFFYASIPFAFALSDPHNNALAASALLAAFMGTSSSFLAFAAIAGQQGRKAQGFPQKGIYYLGGITEGTETVLAFAAMCLFPNLFPVIAWTFALLSLLTTLLRWIWGWRSL
jgi:phosphatidylglycerophosphate synthase